MDFELAKEITCVYGKPATGKTTLAMTIAIHYLKQNKKVLYLDTENGFNIDRFKQIAGNEFDSFLDNFIMIRTKNFQDQCEKIDWLKENYAKFGLIILDTISHFYRKLVHDSPKEINVEMAKQVARLARVSKEVPILILNQVYEKADSDEVMIVGGKLVKDKCERLIELSNRNNKRKIMMKKPVVGEKEFKIEEKGLVLQ